MAYTRTMNGKVPQVLQELHFDETPTPGSLNPVTSGGVAEKVDQQSSNIAPEYTKQTYEANSYVMHDGVLYTNENAIGTAEDWNPTHWTQTTVAEMFSQGGFVNLGDYCVGDGVTDDSDGIQNALIDAAGGTLIVPTGTYLFSKTLVVPSNTRVVGQGSSSIFKLAETYSLTAVAWRSGNSANKYPYIMTTQDSENVVLENFVLVGQTGGFVDMNEDGIMLQGTGHKASRLIVHEINYYPDQFTEKTCLCPAWGIDLYRANHCIVENVRIYHCGYEDIGVENSKNITIRNSSFGDAKQTRVQVHRSSSNVWIDSNEITAEDGGGAYLTLDAPVSLPMKDIFITNNRVYGYVTAVSGGENNVYMIGNYFGSEISRQNVPNASSNWVIANNHIMRHVTLNVDVVAINGNIIENSLNREYAITLEGTQDSHVAHVGNIVLAGNEINIITT